VLAALPNCCYCSCAVFRFLQLISVPKSALKTPCSLRRFPFFTRGLQAALRSLQHLQLNSGLIRMQRSYTEVAHFIGALTSLRSLEVIATNCDSENKLWHVLLKESYAPL
jgi:hypothetical protein